MYVYVCGCVCVCVCVHLRKRRGGVEVVVHGEEREKLVRTEINKKLNTHATSARVNLHGYCSSLKILDDFTHF